MNEQEKIMALPILNSSRYETRIPSTGKQIEFRPFLVKEEKILMVAMESKDSKLMMKALKDVLKACIYDDIDVDKLTSFDLEEIFLRLRSKSVGEKVQLNLGCSECGAKTPVELNLDNIGVTNMPEDRHVMLTDSIGVSFNYPSVDLVTELEVSGAKEMTPEQQVELTYKMIVSCIDNIFSDEEVWDAENQTEKELQEFMDGLNSQQFAKVTDFFGNLPALEHEVEYNCISCGANNSTELRGLSSFF